ncbi:MAG: SGNH/GDSL hydrolase family protein [Terrabacter sp.]
MRDKGARMPSGAPEEPPGHGSVRPAGYPRPHHVVAAVLGLAVLVALVVTGVVPDVVPDAPPGGTSGQHPGRPAASASAAGTDGATGGTAYASPSPSPTPTGPLTLVGLGDSVPSADTCGCTGYVEQVGSRLRRLTQRPWVVHNDATGGWTTADVEQDLASPSTSRHLSAADLVIIEVGANDFDLDLVDDPSCLPASTSSCWRSTMSDLRTGLSHIVSDIRAVDRNRQVQIAVVGYWNVTVDGAVGQARGSAFVAGSDALTRAVNTTIAGVANSLQTIYVDAYTPLKGDGSLDPTSALLDDGDHPNAKGHAIIAKAVLDALTAAGAVAAWTPSP